MTAELRLLLADRELVSAGKMAILGLDGIKARLGPKWDRLSGLVRAFFEAAIKRSIKPGDAFFEVADLDYVVIYRDLSMHETQIKCAVLAREVCAHLFGEEEMQIAVRSLVVQVDRGTLQACKNLQSTIDDCLEQRGTETIISLADCKPSASTSTAKPDFEINFSHQPHTRLRCSADQLSFAYRPIWDCTRSVILTYLCQPMPPGDLGQVLARGAGFCKVSGEDEDRAFLDQTVLSHCARYMLEMRQNGSRLLLGVPLHFTTLAQSRAWGQFSKTYRSIARDVLCDIVFMVSGLEGVLNVSMVHELPKLSDARYVFCVIERGGATPECGAGVGIHAVGFELPPPPQRDQNGRADQVIGGQGATEWIRIFCVWCRKDKSRSQCDGGRSALFGRVGYLLYRGRSAICLRSQS